MAARICSGLRARRREIHVPLSRSVASLAIDALRKRLGKDHFPVLDVFERLGNFRIGVVTEHALVVHRAYRARIVRLIVPGTHVPVASLFRIPAQGQLLQRVPAGEVKIRLGMVSRAHHEIGLFFVDVGLLPVESDLPPPLV